MNGFKWISLDFTGIHWISLDFTGFHSVSLGFTGFNLGLTGLPPHVHWYGNNMDIIMAPGQASHQRLAGWRQWMSVDDLIGWLAAVNECWRFDWLAGGSEGLVRDGRPSSRVPRSQSGGHRPPPPSSVGDHRHHVIARRLREDVVSRHPRASLQVGRRRCRWRPLCVRIFSEVQ